MMDTSIDKQYDSPHFLHLPSFAQFIIDTHLKEYIESEATIFETQQVSTTQFSVPQNAVSGFSAINFLKSIACDDASNEISNAVNSWEQYIFGQTDKRRVQLDDLILLDFLRKKNLSRLVKQYTDDPDLHHQITDELDRFFLLQDIAFSRSFSQLLTAQIEEDNYFRRKLTTTSPGFYYLFDMVNDKQLQTSDKLFDYLGYGKQEYEGNAQFFSSLFHPDDVIPAANYVDKLAGAQDGEVLFFEYRLRTKDGEYKWMRNYESIYYRNEEGIAAHSIGVTFDITKEHFATSELVKREEDLLEAQEFANIGSFILHIKTGETVLTPQALKILGLTNGQSIYHFEKKVHPADSVAVKKAFNDAINNNSEFDIEYRCTVDSSERIIWGRGKVVIHENEEIVMKGTVMDVTDRHHMIQRLKRSEQLNSQAQSMNKLGNWTWEIQKDRLTWSDELYRIYGMEPQSEAVNFEKFIAFVHPDDRDGRLQRLQEQMHNTELKDYYFRIVTRDGSTKVLYGQSQVLANEEGIPYKMIGTCQDVTKQKELETALYQKTVQLERSNASLEEFAYITSHDLKEPLRKIAVFGDRLLKLNHNELGEDHKMTINKIVGSAARMQRMVDDILSLSRITFNLSFTKTDLNVLLKEVIQDLDYKIEASSIKITHDHLPVAVVNETQFRQLFQNLLSNSIKFSRPDHAPKINISFNYLEKDEVKKNELVPLKKYLRIMVLDNGIGFENEFGEKIFTIFQRLHSRDEFEGTGIGLAICKKIVEHHHGLIFGSGELNKGALFTIIIPEEQ